MSAKLAIASHDAEQSPQISRLLAKRLAPPQGAKIFCNFTASCKTLRSDTGCRGRSLPANENKKFAPFPLGRGRGMGKKVCASKIVMDGLRNRAASYSSSTAAAVPLLPQEKAGEADAEIFGKP